ncbi:hypothetical protein KSP39_PZI012174 [Platanthera zijinensis]|uniref:Uncharacterized protein n=1 Tax=Platanthera zijinensis TaxID=2320716 RepID=A0AAP0BFU5_9ASPA
MYRRPLHNTLRRSRTRSIRGKENNLNCNPLAQRTHKVHRKSSSSNGDQITSHHRRSTVEANCTRARYRHQATPPERNSIKTTAPPQSFAATLVPPERNFVKVTAPPQAFAATPARHHILASPSSHGVAPTATTGGILQGSPTPRNTKSKTAAAAPPSNASKGGYSST